MNKLTSFLEGKRTYITGIIMVAYGLAGLYLGHLDHAQAMQIVGSGAGMIFIRKAIANQ